MKTEHAKSVAAIIWLVCLCLVTSMSQKTKENVSVCRTPVCVERANIIKSYMDPCVDPCDDFYSYACGGWLNSTTIPEDLSRYGTMQMLEVDLQNTLKGLLESITLNYQDTQNITDKAAIAYNACLAVPEKPDDRDEFLQLLNVSGFGDWPITEEKTLFNNWTDVVLKAGISTFLYFGVGKDRETRASHIIQIDQIAINGRNQILYPNESQYNFNVIQAYKDLIKKTVFFVRPNISEENCTKLADELMEFERQLANLTTPPEQRVHLLLMYLRTNISTLESHHPAFPLLELLNQEFALVNMTLNGSEKVEMYGLPYYEKLIDFLNRSDVTTLYNYVGLKKTLRYGGLVSKDIRNASFELEKVQFGVLKQTPRWKVCVNFVNTAMSVIAGFLYVHKKFSPGAKEEVEDLVERLKYIFSERLNKSKWMDPLTRANATEKLEKMRAKIGYQPWLLNTTVLQMLGKYIPHFKENDTFLWISSSILRNNWAHSLLLLRQLYNKTEEWTVGPTVVNAFYSRDKNDMSYPSAILQGLFYTEGLPRSISFGAIGSVVGHELTHGFDNEGRQYDAYGDLRQWWTNSSYKNFEKRAFCFVYQYGNICDAQAQMKLNGFNTVNENIADNGGLRTAYKAYKHYFKKDCEHKDVRLAGLEHLSGRKLFFISHAMIWCTLSRTQELQNQIQYDEHSPAQYRVNIPLKNMRAFSRVFNCSAGSPMKLNKNETCKLW